MRAKSQGARSLRPHRPSRVRLRCVHHRLTAPAFLVLYSRMESQRTGGDQTSNRGTNFSPAEDLALARSFVRVSQLVAEMEADSMWIKVANVYASQPEAVTARSAHSLRCRWSCLQRTAQKYIAAEKLYRANIPSGETEEDTVAHVQELYSNRNNVSGQLAPVFKSTAAAALLATCPKFSSDIGGSSSTPWYRPAPIMAPLPTGSSGNTSPGEGPVSDSANEQSKQEH